MKTKYAGINWRSFISIYMGFSFLVMTMTGITLYISPPGRVAHWSNWLFLGISKEDWQSLHTLFSFIWVIAIVFHLIFNWKPILSYIRKKVDTGNEVKKELILAGTLSFLVFFGTFLQVTPFNYVMEFGEYMTESWSTEETEPPVPHAELLTVTEFSKTIGITTKEFTRIMEENGFDAKDTLMSIQTLGAEFKLAPSFIYSLFKEKTDKLSKPGLSDNNILHTGSGYGRKYISAVFKEKNISWEEGILILNEKGIIVSEDDKLKKIAEKNNILPVDLINMLDISKK